MRRSIKSSFDARIGSIKFASHFTESPCSPVVTFPGFGSERHDVRPPQGDSFFHLRLVLNPIYVFPCNRLFFYLLNWVRGGG